MYTVYMYTAYIYCTGISLSLAIRLFVVKLELYRGIPCALCTAVLDLLIFPYAVCATPGSESAK